MLYYPGGYKSLCLLPAQTMSHFKLLPVIVFCLLCVYVLCRGVLFAADSSIVIDESDSIYGRGVHAFFDRHYEEAITILSKAEELKSDDPRPYYFLGLACLRQKKTEQADQYFKKAAQQEYSGRTLRDYAVSESLRRIQGEERVRIEKIRTEERTNAQIREQRNQAARYGSNNAAAREGFRQSTLPHQKEDIAALQQAADDFGENAFGVKPMNPLTTTTENIVARTSDSNPFGTVVVNVSEEPDISVPTPSATITPQTPTPRSSEPTATGSRRTLVNTNIPAAKQESPAHQASGSGNTSQVEATAKEIGRALGTLFSKRTNTE